MPANLENSAEATGLEKSVFIPISKKSNAKEYSNYNTIALISHASRVMLKIHYAGLQQYVNQELPDVQGGFRKAEEPEITLPTSVGSREFQKNIYFCLTDYAKKPLTVWITIICGKFLKTWEYQTTLPVS